MTKVVLEGKRIKRIAHLADIHARLFKRADEYRTAFERLEKDLIAAGYGEDDLIVIAGDLAHSKSDVSPELIDLLTTLLRKMTSIAPTIIIAGNHDANLANMSRLDVLSPIVDALQLPNLHYLKHSGVTRFGNLDIATFSILDDPASWPTADDCTADTKIVLFHGPVFSATTDVGYEITSRHHDISMFDGFDVALLGDIHRHQTLQSHDPTAGKPIVVYASSLIQQNHGELPTGHGWCDWNIPSRSFVFHELPNDYGYYTIRVNGKKLPDTSDMPKNVRLRLFTGELDETEIKKYLTTLRLKHNIVECSVTRPHTTRLNQQASDSKMLDVTDVSFQNKLLTEWIQAHVIGASDALIEKVIDINIKLNPLVQKDDVARQITWIPKSLKFDNLFTYGEGSEVNFDSLQGIVGLFAPNAHGKSSIPDAICFALYDRTPRTTLSANFMNTRKNTCFVEFLFTIGTAEYGITRKGKRSAKGEVKIDVDFWTYDATGERVSLNGEKRQATNGIIRQYVGDFDDFLLTAFSVQDKNSLFIDRGQSDRKDVLNQFMGLKVCEDLYDAAKEESKTVAALLRQFKQEDISIPLTDAKNDVEALIETEQELTRDVFIGQQKIDGCDAELQAAYDRRRPVKTLGKTVDELNRFIASQTDQTQQAVETKRELEVQIAAGPVIDTAMVDEEITKIKSLIERGQGAVVENRRRVDEDAPVVDAAKKQVDDLTKRDVAAKRELALLTQRMATYEKKIAVLATHKYDPNCEYCVQNEFVKDARLAAVSLAEAKVEREEVAIQCEEIHTALARLGDVQAAYMALSEKRDLLSRQELKLAQLETDVQMLERKKATLESSAIQHHQALRDKLAALEEKDRDRVNALAAAEQMLLEHESQKGDVVFNDAILDEIIRIKAEKQQVLATRAGMEQELVRTTAKIAVLHSRIDDMLKKIKQAETHEADHKAYAVYMEAMCRDGVPYQLVSEIIPQIETDINNILSQMTEFALMLDVDGKNINARIVYDDTRMWPLELASGMEKFITGLAIRVALMNISSLPKSNFLIIDEGFGALDADMHGSLSMLFTLLKTQFDFVLLISHLESLRDVTDQIIDIDRHDGFSRIKVA